MTDHNDNKVILGVRIERLTIGQVAVLFSIIASGLFAFWRGEQHMANMSIHQDMHQRQIEFDERFDLRIQRVLSEQEAQRERMAALQAIQDRLNQRMDEVIQEQRDQGAYTRNLIRQRTPSR